MTCAPSPIDLGRIASVLDTIQAEIEELGSILCRDEQVMALLIGELQGIDRIAQHIRGIASVLRSNDPRRALQQVGLEGLEKMLLDETTQLRRGDAV